MLGNKPCFYFLIIAGNSYKLEMVNKMSKLTKEAKKEAFISVMNKLTVLAAKREGLQVEFDNTDMKRYELLAECLSIYKDIKGQNIEKETLFAIKEELIELGFKIQVNTRVLTLIVRYVFKNDRNRAYTYNRVLSAALLANVKPDELAHWIHSFGGIQEVFITKGITQETLTKRQKLEGKKKEVIQIIESLKAPLAIFPETPLVHHSETTEYVLLLGKCMGDGSGTKVLTTIPNSSDSMVNEAFKKIAQALINDPNKNIYSEEQKKFSFYKLPVSVVDDNHEVAIDEISDKEIMIAERDALFQY